MSRIKVSGSWRGPNSVWIKVSGAWRESFESFAKVGGAWRRGTVTVPDVIGQTRTNANSTITGRGLVVGTQTATSTTNTALDQQIISTSPSQNVAVDSGSSVD